MKPEYDIGYARTKWRAVLEKPENLFVILAIDLAPDLERVWGVKLVIKKKLSGSDLENCRL